MDSAIYLLFVNPGIFRLICSDQAVKSTVIIEIRAICLYLTGELRITGIV